MKHFTILIFAMVVGIITIVNLLLPPRSFSEFENRYLSQKPDFHWNDLISGRYTEKYESYVADQFIFRNQWMGLKAFFEEALLKKENNNIIFGKKGYLFNKYLTLADNFFTNVETLNSFLQIYKDQNIYVAIAPNSYTILEDLVPIGLYNVNQAKWLQWLKEELNLSDRRFIDLYQALKKHTNKYIYYRLDHHWTSTGAYYAYEAYSKEVGFLAVPLEKFTPKVIEDFYGTFYSAAKKKKGKADFIWYDPHLDANFYVDGVLKSSIYDLSFADGRDKYAMFLHNNPSRASIKSHLNSKTDRKKLLVFKDSYANSMIPFLTNHYAQIEIIDLRYYNGSIAALMNESWDHILFLFNFISFSKDPYLVKLKY
ncbi:DHHW family protein [Orenia marismortui]|uniref:DHHW family protein n=1 Tax=Orenia marismortui TaxID=46469 RepID=UPI000360A89E|nr:DHHW family protein [Orenia marismortui]